MEDGAGASAVEAQLCKLEAGVAESFPAVVIHPIGGMPVGLVARFHGQGGPARAEVVAVQGRRGPAPGALHGEDAA
jgi:hypothetical protein